MKIRSVKFNFFMNSITTVVNFLFPLITFPYVSRVLTPSGYGEAEFALSTAQLFALVALLGVNTYGLRECAKVRDDISKQTKVFQELFVVMCVWTILVTLFYYVGIFLVPRFSESMDGFLIAGFLIPLTSLSLQWYMAANEQYAFMAVRNIIIKIVVVVAMFLFVHSSADLAAWLILSVLSTGLASIANYFYVFKSVKIISWANLELKKHLKPLLIFFLMVASISIYTTLDSVMLGYMTDDTQVAFYSVAVKIKNIFTAIIASLANVLIPRVSYAFANGDKSNYYRLINISVKVAIVYAIFSTLSGIIFAGPIVILLAGEGYYPAISILTAILPAVLFISFTQITALEILTPQNKEKILAITYLLAGVVDIVLNLLLIPSLQGLGAAIATTVAEGFVFISQFTIIARRENVRPYLQGILRLVPGMLISSIVLLAGRLLFGVSLGATIGVVCFSLLTLIVGLAICKEPLVADLYTALVKILKKY